MLDRPTSKLAEAAELRAQAARQRLAAIVAIAAALNIALGWTFVWLWAAGYAAATLLEGRLGQLYLARIRSGQRPSGRSYVASIALVSLTYASLSVPLLLFEHERDGEVYGVILLAGALINSLVVSRGSWAAFLATAIPYGGFMAVNPVLAWVAGVDALSWVTIFGVALVVLHAYAAWRHQRLTLQAEAAARVELDKRRQEAESATAAKSAFVAMVSHELRTPLSGIMAAGDQLARANPGPAAEVVVDAGRFMQTLLDDLLDLAKVEAGRMTVEAVTFDLGHMLWTAERHWTAAADRAGKPVRLVSALNLPIQVSADPTRLRQILNNLLSNALKFTGPEGVTWRVDGQEDGDLWWLEMRVTDTGPGIPADRLDRLFTPFDQTDDTIARTHGGTGLGLALSRELARLMGGDLTVESEPGRGSTFILALPAGRVQAQALGPAEPDTAAPAGGLRVLVVDDHEINRRTAALLLEPAGIEVTTAASGAEALQLLGGLPFDVVVTDINMPDMNGLQLARAIRERVGLNRSVPVLAFTGGDSPAELAACRAAGMHGFISKPVNPGALYRAIEEACAGRPRAAERLLG